MPTCCQIIPCLASSMGNFIVDTMEWNVMVIILIVLLSIQWDSLRFDAQSRDSNGRACFKIGIRVRTSNCGALLSNDS